MSIIMDMYKVKWTRLQSEIIKFLCISVGRAVSLRELSRKLHKTPTAVSNGLIELKKDGIVRVEKSENIKLLSIELERDNPKVIEIKRIENLKLIYESGLSNYLRENFPGSTIILFGSYSKGEDIRESDIDIAVIGKEKETDLSDFDKRLERKIIINFYDSFKKIHKHLLENILNGIILNGGVEL